MIKRKLVLSLTILAAMVMLSAAAVIGFAPLGLGGTQTAYAAEIPEHTATFNIETGSGSGSGYSWGGTTLNLTNTAGTVLKVTGTVSDGRRISVTANANVDIILDNVSITSVGNDNPAILLDANATLRLWLVGENTLRGGANRSAITARQGTTLVIDGTGSLTATGGAYSAGIGGYSDNTTNTTAAMRNGGTITINGGTVTATATTDVSGGGAGIGGARGIASTSGGNGGTITINGGTVEASGGGAGIGGGMSAGSQGGSGGTITINGGTVTATGSGVGAGIGGGGSLHSTNSIGGDAGNITITGGRVTARSSSAAGIGGGGHNPSYGTRQSGGGGTIAINGGSVNASGNGVGIGAGPTGDPDPGTFTMNGNAVVFALDTNYYGNDIHISDASAKTSGVLVLGSSSVNSGETHWYGADSKTIADVFVPTPRRLTIPSGKSLTVTDTLTVTGRLENNGTVTLGNTGRAVIAGSRTNNLIVGSGVSGAPTQSARTADSITVSAVNLSNPNTAQTIEYGISTTNNAAAAIWQDDRTFTGLNPNTIYYIFARSKQSTHFAAGTASPARNITTDRLQGSAVNVSAVTTSRTETAITIETPATLVTATGQDIEYGISTTNAANATGWQTTLTFATANTTSTYYIFARSAENDTYARGTARLAATVNRLYSVTVQNDGNGAANANTSLASAGTEITLTATPSGGYQFKEWQAISGSVTITDNKFTMPASNVTIMAVFQQITHTVTVEQGTGSGEFAAGQIVTITAGTAPLGKEFDKWTSADGVTFVDEYDTTTTFAMPAGNVTVTATFKDLPADNYNITVEINGNGTANSNTSSAIAGTEITLTATPSGGYQFKEWQVVSGGITIVDNKFTMPENEVTVKAIFEAIAYDITVTGGTADKNQATIGETITVTSGTAPTGKEFDKWVSTDGVEFANENSASTTFTMIAGNVAVTATFKDILYTVTVTDGTANSSTAVYGETVSITAGTAPTGKEFDKWIGTGGVEFVDANSATTTFAMPASNVTVTATFKNILYTITVVDGTVNSLTATYGTTVTITAVTAPTGKVFDKWVSTDGIDFADENATNTTFTMIAGNATVTATFKDLPVGSHILTVENNGYGTANANVTHAEAGTEITLTATVTTNGYRFKEWQVIDGDITIEDNKFTMPDGAVTVKAMFEQITYAVTVIGGTGGGEYAEGATVTITAGTAPTGKVFDKWTTDDGVEFVDANSASTTFTMLGKAVTVTATYKDAPEPPTYTIEGGGTGTVAIDKDGGYAFTINSGNAVFEWLEVTNGTVTLEEDDYTVTAGSTIITLTAAGLEKLGAGTHTLTAHFTGGGTATMILTITAAGDDKPFPWWILGVVGGVLLLGGLATWFAISRRKKTA